jgi:transcriptional regulator with XRE-family HTH domain
LVSFIWQLTFEDAMAQEPNPTAHKWELAARLRQLRTEAGMSVEEVAAELMCSPAKISRMESAGRGVQARDIRDLARFYGLSAAVQAELTQLAKDAKTPGWWQDFRAVGDPRTTFFGLETAAEAIRLVEIVRIPGLFQTEEFTKSLLPFIRPPGELSDQWIRETATARIQRQRRITSGDLAFHVILDEAALRRPVGGQSVMRRQVERLLEDAARPNVELQVIPFYKGPHPGIDGSFHHLSFPGGWIDDVVFLEGLRGDFVLDRAADVARYRLVFDDLSSRYALDAEETIDWLDKLLAEYAPSSEITER